MSLFIGIDIGTTFCKAVVCSARGELRYCTTRRNDMLVNGALAEERCEQWWDNICSMTREICAHLGDEAGDIAALGISCAGAMMAVDADGEPLTAAIMQMDKRSMKQMLQLREMERAGKLSLQNPVTDGVSSLQILMHLKAEHPEIYTSTYKFMTPNGYIAYKLTGRYTAEMSRWSTSLLMDLKKKCWDAEVCRKTIGDADKLPELVASDHVVGTLTEAAARETGLPRSTKVVAGMLDTSTAGLGLGVLGYNEAYMVLGTFGKLCVVSDENALDDKRFANFTYVDNDLYIKYMAIDGGCGLAVNWFKDCFGAEENAQAEAQGKSVYALLDEKAAGVRPGCDGLVFLPYLTGGKSPTWNLNAKGVFFGITKGCTKGHFFRAVLESIAYSARMNLELYEQSTGTRVERVKICGGGSKSPVWAQLVADILGRPLELMESQDSEACGAAYIAIKSVCGYPDYSWVPSECVRRIEPIPANAELYNAYFPVYKELFSSLASPFRALTAAKAKADSLNQSQ